MKSARRRPKWAVFLAEFCLGMFLALIVFGGLVAFGICEDRMAGVVFVCMGLAAVANAYEGATDPWA